MNNDDESVANLVRLQSWLLFVLLIIYIVAVLRVANLMQVNMSERIDDASYT